MKFKANNIELKQKYNGEIEIVLICKERQKVLLKEFEDNKQQFKDEIAVSLDKWHNKRSLNHNALFWDMCQYLVDTINDITITTISVYRELIKLYGVSVIYPVDDNILDMVIKDWQSRGDGWLTEKLRKSKLDGNFTNVQFWFGSSIYDSKQFNKLVEGLKQMCKDNDVDISQYDKQMTTLIEEMEKRENALKYIKKIRAKTTSRRKHDTRRNN